MNTISNRPAATGWRPRRDFVAEALAAAILVAVLASPLADQNPGALQKPRTFRLWAAQTGPNQVSLAWNSVPGAAEYLIHLGDPSVPGTLTQRPASVLSASGAVRSDRHPAHGERITLVAVDARGRVLRQESLSTRSFPRPVPAGHAAHVSYGQGGERQRGSPLEGTPSGRHSTHPELTPLAARRRWNMESDTSSQTEQKLRLVWGVGNICCLAVFAYDYHPDYG